MFDEVEEYYSVQVISLAIKKMKNISI